MKHSVLRRSLAIALFALPAAAHETEEHKVLASDGAAGDGFGRAVSIHESTMAVGAPTASGTGAVYVYSYDGTDWIEEAKLVPSDGAAGDLFGLAVSVSHETVIVGAPRHDAAGAEAGAAYVFVHDGISWNEEAKLQSSTIAAGDAFGAAVAVDEDTAIVGAPRNAGAGPVTGSAFVFVRSGTLWSEEDELTASAGVAGNQFGRSVALHEDTAVVGAPRQDGVAAGTGAAYVFGRAAAVWSEDQKLQASDGAFNDFFGGSVALFRDLTIVVGASLDDDNGANSGSTYQFNQVAGSWNQGVKRSGAKAGDVFGSAVAHSYRSTIVGSRLLDAGPLANAGAALLYVNFGNRTGFEVYVASDPAAGKLLGASVSTTPCFVAVGSPGDTELGVDAGAVYTYVIAHPSATTENGSGVNALCLTTVEEPIIGEHWRLEVDTTAFPAAASTTVVVHANMRATPKPSPVGEILVDRSSAVLLVSSLSGTGVVEHEFQIPLDPYLTGVDVAVQAIVRSGAPGSPILGLCNAERVRIGCEGEGDHHTE
jgi:hypothetical protein